MSDRMNKYKRDLKALAECSSKRVHYMIRKGDDDFILAIVDAVWTTLDRRVKLLPKHRRTIQSVQSVLLQFASVVKVSKKDVVIFWLEREYMQFK